MKDYFGPGATPAVYPADANSIAIVAPTAQWTFGAYTQLVASTPSDFVLCGISSFYISDSDQDGVVQLATGAAASEVPFEEISFGSFAGGGTPTAIINVNRLIHPYFIPSGTRISGRQALGNPTNWDTLITYLYGYTVPPAFAVNEFKRWQLLGGFTGKGGVRWPATDYVTMTHVGTAWAWSTWNEIEASADEACLIEAVTVLPVTSSRHAVIELGVGASTAEVPLPAWFPVPGVGTFLPRHDIPASVPLFVPKGSRIAARFKSNSTTGNQKIAIKVSFIK
jgi:hypothetical protein